MQMKNYQLFRTIFAGVVVLVLAVLLVYVLQQKREMDDLIAQAEFYKEQLEDEYNDLSVQYEGFKLQISNDSLVARLETEQLKVQRLQEELRTVKASNTRRIGELRRELEALRTVMRGYVAQIDSLDRLNKKLVLENQSVQKRYREASRSVSQLTQEKEQLLETVQIASMLDASGITVSGITNRNKTTDRIKKMDQLEVSFVINKNITAETGEKTVYIRIQKPDDELLTKNAADRFSYEDKEIGYSAKRTIEYTGEETAMSIYWKIEEFLLPGVYRVDIFADGCLIGRKSFELKK
jgi:cell division protein FtsL